MHLADEISIGSRELIFNRLVVPLLYRFLEFMFSTVEVVAIVRSQLLDVSMSGKESSHNHYENVGLKRLG